MNIMSHPTRLLVVLGTAFFLASAHAQTYLRTNSVANNSQLTAALALAIPGDVIQLANGNYSGFTVARGGTASNPILIRSANLGGATNNTGIIKFSAVSNVALQGLTLTTSGGSLTVDETARYVGMVLTNCTSCRITRCNFKIIGAHTGTAWVMIGGPSISNRVDHCDFGPNAVGGSTHFIWPVGDANIPGVTAPSDRMPFALGYGPFNPNIARYTQIDHNYFHDEGSGDGEIMVLGAIGETGDYQDTHTLVEYNLFSGCDGDPEIISVKSSSNTLRFNTVTNSAGVFSLRAGNNDSVYGNYFFCGGTGGGVKISERDHKVFNNYIENSDTSNYPLMLESGNLYNINFAHAQVARSQIVHNTVVNPGRQVLFAHSGSLPVVDSIFANNIITGSGTLYTESVASLNPVRSQNIIFGYSPSQSGFLVENPLLTGSSPQRLSASSPAINAGNLNYYPYVTDDMDGQPRNLPRDIGADEYYLSAFIARPPLTTNVVGPGSVIMEMSATPRSQSVDVGATNVGYTIAVVSDAGFVNPVTLTVNGLLPGISAGFNPSTVTGSGTSTLNITNSGAVLGGNYSFIVTATSGNLQSSATVILQVGRSPVNLNWAGTGTTPWMIQDAAIWLNASSNVLSGFYNGDSVVFDDTAGVQTNITISVGVAVSPAIITNSSSTNNFTISGAGKITGATRFVKTGASTLTLNTVNDFAGGMLIAGGIVKPGNPYALGGQSGFIILTNGATLDVNGNNLGLDSVLVSGTGLGNNGAIINSGAPVYPALAVIELAGDTTIGGTNRWDLRGANGNQTASLSTSGNAYNLTKVGTNFIGIVDVTVDPSLGNINVQSGTLDIEASTTCLGDPGHTLNVFTNATLEFWNTVFSTNYLNLNKHFILNDGATILNGSGANYLLSQITLNGSAAFNVAGASLTCSNNVGGSGKLIKTGSSPLNLVGANTFAGSTVVGSGSVVLSANGSLANSTNLNINAGAILDVSGRNDQTLTLNRGQTLTGNGTVNGRAIIGSGAILSPGGSIGTLAFNSDLTLNSGSLTLIELSKSPIANDSAQVGGNLTYGGTLVLTNISNLPLAAGDSFKLFNATGYSGAFTNILPVIPGINLAWNTNSLTNGTLSVIASATPPPAFGVLQFNGTSLIFRGSNGVPGWPYDVLVSTNMSLPLSDWTPVATNTFDANGGFNFTNSVEANVLQQFYLLRLQ